MLNTPLSERAEMLLGIRPWPSKEKKEEKNEEAKPGEKK